jgi:DNA replication protein DnaC
MLQHPTLEKLQALNLIGMVHALQEQLRTPECARLSFEERLGLLVDRETTEQENRRLARRLGQARLRQAAVLEDVDFRHPRGLERALLLSLASCQWVRDRRNCLITGPTGVGKTYLACALAQKACREGRSAHYARVSRLLEELAVARADGSYSRRLTALSRFDLLVLDDWGLAPLTDQSRRDLLEILDDRYDRRATLVASQLPVENWHEALADPTLADAILDRLVHNAHRIALHGESMRKQRAGASAAPIAEASRDASQEGEE